MTIAGVLLSSLWLLGSTPNAPKPVVKATEVTDEPRRQVPDRILGLPDGSFYVLRTSEDDKGWPTAWVDRHDTSGAKVWSHLHEIYRTPAGEGFDTLLGATVDAAGDLVFAYHSETMVNSGGRIVKLRKDGSVAWEAVAKHRPVQLVAMTGNNDVAAVSGQYTDIFATRFRGSDGEEVWDTRHDSAKNDSGHIARATHDGGVIVVTSYGENFDRTAKITKFSAAGDELWSRTHGLPSSWYSGGLPHPKAVLVTSDDSIYAVYHVTSEKKIEVHRYGKDGRLQRRHAIDTADYLDDGAKIVARLGTQGGLPALIVAWDTRESDVQPGPEIGVAKLRFYEEASAPAKLAATRRPAPGVRAGTKTRSPRPQWKVTESPQWHAPIGNAFLGAMCIGYAENIYVATTERPAADEVRITVLPRSSGDTDKSITFAVSGRNARAIDMFCAKTRLLHLVGTVDDDLGAPLSADVDAFRLTAWMKPTVKVGPAKTSPALRRTRR